MADDVQTGAEPASPEGAVQGDGGSGLYDLDSVPQELREQLEPHLKAIDANVTKKFQEASEYRKQWEPYEQLGVNQIDPDTLSGLIDFANLAEDDQAFAEWFEKAGQEAGLFEQLGYTKADDLDNELGLDEGLSPEKITELVSQAVAEQLQPVNEQLTAQQQEQVVREAEQGIADQWAKIVEENPDLPEGAKDAVHRFALSFADDGDDDPLGKGFEEYKRIVAQGENGLFAKKSGQPGPVEGPGSADTSAPRITSFEDASAAAKERLEKSLAT